MRTDTRHTCRAVPSCTTERAYAGPVKSPENRAAHGNITRHEVCRCGAARAININGRHSEVGTWHGGRYDA